MNYVFSIRINTDCDFNFPYVPNGMREVEYGVYEYSCNFTKKKDAVNHAKEVCNFLKDHFKGSETNKLVFYGMIDKFFNDLNGHYDRLNSIYNSGYLGFSLMGGNYEGTEVFLKEDKKRMEFTLFLDDDEYDYIAKHYATVGSIRDELLKNMPRKNKIN